MRPRVVVAMSGGVDSSVAAALLVEAGYDCVGVFMRHAAPILPPTSTGPLPVLPTQPGHQGCCSPADALDAHRVADRLGIPLYALDLSDDFERVIADFVSAYGGGRTPNPCVRCNSWIKFGKLFEHADGIGAELVATGHYAQLEQTPAGPVLRRGLDPSRDQSYVLFDIDPDRMRRILLPVGTLSKATVRARAAALGLATAEKPDSQEICFVAPGEHARLVAHRLGGTREGAIVDSTGRVLGRHPGIEHFTVGQRQGLGIATGTPLYVIRIEAASRHVVVGPRSAVPQTNLVATAANWLGPAPTEPFECLVQCRAQRAAAPALVTPLAANRFMANFVCGPDETPGAISPGQPAVCYSGDRLLGGGWIED